MGRGKECLIGKEGLSGFMVKEVSDGDIQLEAEQEFSFLGFMVGGEDDPVRKEIAEVCGRCKRREECDPGFEAESWGGADTIWRLSVKLSSD